ncbi:hypothetical protein TNCV_520661 [Trichonephila clavipes]|nr:hypothetical protein TNCV_520661 [Trichonephila clavipes]
MSETKLWKHGIRNTHTTGLCISSDINDVSAPVSHRAVMNVLFKRMGTYGIATGVILNEKILEESRGTGTVDVFGYKVVEEKATDYAHLKQALTEQFPVF